jgi:exoribonuclease R
MPILNWIAGTLELSSKVRYGMTSRGVPLFKFIPYDKKLSPFAVGCQTRDLFYNVHAIVEPSPSKPVTTPTPFTIPHANLIQNLGAPNEETEEKVLLQTYAYDNKKHLRKYSQNALPLAHMLEDKKRDSMPPGSFTFHIDDISCEDVDDAFTFYKQPDNSYKVWIHIADVSSFIPFGSEPDIEACERGTSFYTPSGYAIAPMFHKEFSECSASLSYSNPLLDTPKPTLSLSFTWIPGVKIDPTSFSWSECNILCDERYSYEEAFASKKEELLLLKQLTSELGADSNDSHTWVAELMILYNKTAGKLLKEKKKGILRKQAGKKAELYKEYSDLFSLYPQLQFLATDSAEYCSSDSGESYHEGLQTDHYAHASSPLRRYSDLVNQRALKNILFGNSFTQPSDELITHLNKREKQSRAFQRDLFFSTSLTNPSTSSVKGVVINIQPSFYKIYVSEWKRVIKVKVLEVDEKIVKGTSVSINWFDDRTKANWKDRIVFKITE